MLDRQFQGMTEPWEASMRYSDMATLIREAEGATSESLRLAKLADALLDIALAEEDSGSRPRPAQATTGQRVHSRRMAECTTTAGKPSSALKALPISHQRAHGPTASGR